MSAVTPPSDAIHSPQMTKARPEAAFEIEPGSISLPDLYTHVIDRLEDVFEADWIFAHGREASHLEDEALKLRLWASQNGLTGHESFTTQSGWLQTNQQLVSWTRVQLFEIDSLIGVLTQHANDLGYRSSVQR